MDEELYVTCVTCVTDSCKLLGMKDFVCDATCDAKPKGVTRL